jgi:hypothetical protein
MNGSRKLWLAGVSIAAQAHVSVEDRVRAVSIPRPAAAAVAQSEPAARKSAPFKRKDAKNIHSG